MMNTHSPFSNPTKMARIRAHFLEGKSLTSLEAIYEFGITRLAAVVHKLTALGWQFEKVREEYHDPGSGYVARYVRYSLTEEYLEEHFAGKKKAPCRAA